MIWCIDCSIVIRTPYTIHTQLSSILFIWFESLTTHIHMISNMILIDRLIHTAKYIIVCTYTQIPNFPPSFGYLSTHYTHLIIIIIASQFFFELHTNKNIVIMTMCTCSERSVINLFTVKLKLIFSQFILISSGLILCYTLATSITVWTWLPISSGAATPHQQSIVIPNEAITLMEGLEVVVTYVCWEENSVTDHRAKEKSTSLLGKLNQ